MSDRSGIQRIEDIRDAVREAQEFAHGMSFDQFAADDVIMIGEAASRMPQEIRQRHDVIPWRLMSDLRNKIVHDYFGVDAAILWDTIQNDLPPLLPLLKQVLDDANAG